MAVHEQGTREETGEQFKVSDRRHFTSDGDRRDGFEEEADHERPEPSPETVSAETPEASPGFERRPLDEPEGVDFTMLVNAMAQPALLFLGELGPPGAEAQIDAEKARIQIDLLDLLRVKSRGNLSEQEERLLERVLYELRMLYVARTSQST